MDNAFSRQDHRHQLIDIVVPTLSADVRRRRGRRGRRRRWPWIAGTLAVLLVVPLAYGLVLANRLSGNIQRVDVTALSPHQGGPTNLLVIGSDSREGLSEEDEFLIVTEGTPHLVDDHGRHAMAPGDCAAFPAGEANGHHLVNDTDTPARFLVFGTKAAREVATYSDHDFRIEIEGANATFTYRDGTPWEGVR